MSSKPNFDLLARPYRWLEYLTFGHTLERCRFASLAEVEHARRALVFGDGDGRFLARLMEQNPRLQADVVDLSPAMLRLLYERLSPEAQSRVILHEADARNFLPAAGDYDLIVTHFFLDCLTQGEITALCERLKPSLQPGAFWLLSEFSIPQGKLVSRAGRGIIRLLYEAFGVLTGLSIRKLPDYAAVFRRGGFNLAQETLILKGLLVNQRWQYHSEAKSNHPS